MSDTPDLSFLLNMMNDKNIDISSVLGNMSSSQTDNTGNFDPSSIDMETMMKMARIMSAMNSNDNNDKANLLYALKPFLRDSKKEKIDQYANFLKMSSILNEMNKSDNGKS